MDFDSVSMNVISGLCLNPRQKNPCTGKGPSNGPQNQGYSYHNYQTFAPKKTSNGFDNDSNRWFYFKFLNSSIILIDHTFRLFVLIFNYQN